MELNGTKEIKCLLDLDSSQGNTPCNSVFGVGIAAIKADEFE
jgi:hypothetical protein